MFYFNRYVYGHIYIYTERDICVCVKSRNIYYKMIPELEDMELDHP